MISFTFYVVEPACGLFICFKRFFTNNLATLAIFFFSNGKNKNNYTQDALDVEFPIT